jgi:hypothetical protein
MALVKARSDRSKSGCRIWTGYISPAGMPEMVLNGRTISARRWVYEQTNGPIPDKHRVVATCRCHGCIEPSHLTAIPLKDVFAWLQRNGAMDTVKSALARLNGAASRRIKDETREAVRKRVVSLPPVGQRGKHGHDASADSISRIAKDFGVSEAWVKLFISTGMEVRRPTVRSACIFSLGAALGRQQAGAAR